jgi:hypothetical protein
MATKQFPLRLPSKLYAWVRSQAEKEGRSINNYINRVLDLERAREEEK